MTQPSSDNEQRVMPSYAESLSSQGCLLEFDLGSDVSADKTVYNPSVPFPDSNRTIMLARVESRELETGSQAVVFAHNPFREVWEIEENAPRFSLQDPFFCGNFTDKSSPALPYKVFGGVRIKVEDDGSITDWRTVFYRYKGSICDMAGPNGEPKPFAVGPKKMKDIRIIELSTGRIGVFTRPQGKFGGPGRIGYVETEGLDRLETALQDYDKAQYEVTLIPDLFKGNEWGGANHLELLPDGKIGVYSHKAYFLEREGKTVKDYDATYFEFDPASRAASPLKTIATADAFPYVEPKLDCLGKVLFTAGVEYRPDGKRNLYVGVGDVAIGKLAILDPANVSLREGAIAA